MALTQISDGDYPGSTVPGIAYLNGRAYVMTPGAAIHGSDEDDFTSWNALNIIYAEFEPDGGVFIAKHNEYVLAMGAYSLEPFWDAKNPTASPLSPVENGVVNIGCAHAHSVQQLQSSLIWVAQQKGQGPTAHKNRFVVVMDGMTPTRVSTASIERILNQDTFTTVYSAVVADAGHTFYLLTLSASAVTLVYDLTTKIWYEWNISTAGTALSISSLTQASGTATATSTAHGKSDGDLVTISGASQAGYNISVNITKVDANTFTFPVVSTTVSPATGTVVAAHWTTGVMDISASCVFLGNLVVMRRGDSSIYTVSPTGVQDNSAPIDFMIRTPRFDDGNNDRKFMSSLQVIGDSVGSTALVRTSDDDYTTFSKYHRISLSADRAITHRLGSYRRRSIDIRHNMAFKVRITDLEINGSEKNG